MAASGHEDRAGDGPRVDRDRLGRPVDPRPAESAPGGDLLAALLLLGLNLHAEGLADGLGRARRLERHLELVAAGLELLGDLELERVGPRAAELRALLGDDLRALQK